MNNDGGALLFRVTAYRFWRPWRPWRPTKIVSLVMLALIVPLFISEYSKGGLDRSRSLPLASIALSSLLLLLSPRKVEFYEKGIRFPGEFIAWSDIVGYRWDGDLLIIAERSGLLYGGPTLLGGTVRVPRSRRVQVLNLLVQAR